jgi:hypothetical protein
VILCHHSAPHIAIAVEIEPETACGAGEFVSVPIFDAQAAYANANHFARFAIPTSASPSLIICGVNYYFDDALIQTFLPHF